MTTTSTLTETLKTTFPDWAWQFEFSLAPLTYFKIGGPAEVYLESADRDQVAKLVKWCHEQEVRLTMLGGASNVIVADEGVRGVVLHLIHGEVELLGPADKLLNSGEVSLIRAETGVKMATLVSQVVKLGFQGLEYFLGVPGTLGGAVYNNSHYLQHLIGEHIQRVEVIDHQGHFKWLSQSECDFAYDHSRFQTSKEVIWQVEFALEPGQVEQSQNLIREATEYRARTQPLGIPNSGCIFQNAPNTPELKKRFPQFANRTHLSGGFLIDQAGLKGQRLGDIEISEKHAAFFLNRGQGTARDAKALIAQVKAKVKAEFGVELHEEVFYLG